MDPLRAGNWNFGETKGVRIAKSLSIRVYFTSKRRRLNGEKHNRRRNKGKRRGRLKRRREWVGVAWIPKDLKRTGILSRWIMIARCILGEN